MIAEASLVTVKTKIALGFIFASMLAAADAQVTPWSPEDYTLKGILAAAVVVLWRLVLKQQAEHKSDMAKQQAEHKAEITVLRDKYEEDMKTVVVANTASNEKVAELAEDQATYFRTVTRDIVNEKLHAKTPEHPPLP